MPQCASIVADLISASGYQDHTTSPSAMTPLVWRRHLRPSHPAPNARDDRDTPLNQARDDAEFARDFSARSTAAHWHDGQITLRLKIRVK
jgi:hypothetical protein